MAYNVDRRPATWTSAQAARRERVLWIGIAIGFVMIGAFLAFVVGHHASIGTSFGFAAIVFAIRPYANRYADTTLNWLRGARAEEAVGDMLNELRREGWILMHDVEQAREGNIDHIAAGPNGVFMIETKSRSFMDWQLGKARRQAAKLHDEIGVWVTPVICLHGRDDEPFRKEKVWIVPARHLLKWLREQREKPVDFERLARFADRVK